MKHFQGTKIIEAEPMMLGVYRQMSGRDPYANSPKPMFGSAAGYHVRYKDGYDSWSPQKAFEEAYRPCETFIDRLHIELDELSARIEKLETYIVTNPNFAELGADDRDMLQNQLGVMNEYAYILNKRIANTEEDSSKKK